MKYILIFILLFSFKSQGQKVSGDTLIVSDKIKFIKIGEDVYQIKKILEKVDEKPVWIDGAWPEIKIDTLGPPPKKMWFK